MKNAPRSADKYKLEALRATPRHRAWSREHAARHRALMAEAPPKDDTLNEKEAARLLEDLTP